MPRKNLVLFVVLSFLILIGWPVLQRWLWPPPPRQPKPPEPEVVKLPDPQLWAALPPQAVAILHQAPGIPGLGNLGGLVTQIAVADWSARGGEELVKHEPEPP